MLCGARGTQQGPHERLFWRYHNIGVGLHFGNNVNPVQAHEAKSLLQIEPRDLLCVKLEGNAWEC
jgi:hypothetical protein